MHPWAHNWTHYNIEDLSIKLTALLVRGWLALVTVPRPAPDADGPERRRRSIRSSTSEHRPAAMEKGKGLARRWAVELPDASSSSPAVPDPPGFTRSAPDAVTPTPPRSSLRCFALCPAIHVPALDRRTTPLERASARTPRLHGRRRFVRSVAYSCLV
jgi:hypothetical protein